MFGPVRLLLLASGAIAWGGAIGCATPGPLGLGPTGTARTIRPDLFHPGCHAPLGDVYVVCGVAERAFADDTVEELETEARLDALTVLAEHVGASGLDLAELTPAHAWDACEGRVRMANFTIPVSRVSVLKPRPSPPHATRPDPCSDE